MDILLPLFSHFAGPTWWKGPERWRWRELRSRCLLFQGEKNWTLSKPRQQQQTKSDFIRWPNIPLRLFSCSTCLLLCCCSVVFTFKLIKILAYISWRTETASASAEETRLPSSWIAFHSSSMQTHENIFFFFFSFFFSLRHSFSPFDFPPWKHDDNDVKMNKFPHSLLLSSDHRHATQGLKRSVTTLRGGSLGYAEIVAVKVFVHLRHSLTLFSPLAHKLLNYSSLFNTTMLLCCCWPFLFTSYVVSPSLLRFYGVL